MPFGHLRRLTTILSSKSNSLRSLQGLREASCCNYSTRSGSGGAPSSEPQFKMLKIWEPPYLDEGGSETPLYDLVNIQIKGYDFPVLEAFGKFIHNSATRFGLDVEDSWGTPCKKYHITKLKPESSSVETDYYLNLYDRTVQLADIPSTTLPLFLNFVQAALPAGVTLDAHLHDPAETEVRYVPDHELIKLKSELEAMRAPKK